MGTYEVDFTYDMPEWGSVELEDIDDKEDAEVHALAYIKTTYPDVTNIKIEAVRNLD